VSPGFDDGKLNFKLKLQKLKNLKKIYTDALLVDFKQNLENDE
jgi:prolyl-tRNA synthetase